MYLQSIWSELKAAKPDLNIELVGIDLIGQAASNPLITALHTFPWVQDTTQANVWGRWNATKDDVFIVDSLGRLQKLFRLSDHGLTDPQNRVILKQLFLTAAVITDTNGDGLPEDWGQQYFKGTTVKPNEDPDGDSRVNFTEYAFGTVPNDPISSMPVKVNLVREGPPWSLEILFHRRAGSHLDYFIETSTDLAQWTLVAPGTVDLGMLRNLYDGTGTSEMRLVLKPAANESMGWVRVRAAPRHR